MESPQAPPPIPKKGGRRGLVIVHTGDGKGKTTAALGVALRAVGQGMRVGIVQFIKGKWKTGEQEAAKRFEGLLEILPMGEGFTWETQNRTRDREVARRAWEKCQEFLTDGKHDLVVWDEVNCVLAYDYLPVAEVVDALKGKPPLVHVILTGRDAKPEIIEIADLVTEMRKVKHPFEKGIPAQRGIEF